MPSPESKLVEGVADRYGLGRIVGQGGGGGFGPDHLSLVAEGPFLQTLGWSYTFGLDGRLAALISTPGALHGNRVSLGELITT